MDDLKEQYFCIKFCFILGKTALEMYEMLKTAFGDNGIWKKQTFERFSRFKHRETLVEDCECSGNPFTGCTQKCGQSLQNNQQKLMKYHFGDHWQVRLLI
jgi:hypothetical protein